MILLSVAIAISTLIQFCYPLPLEAGLVSVFLTIFAIFFGFYMTSFAVFASSPYTKTLYQIQDEKNNSKTLLDNLLYAFSNATYTLLFSIIYLIFVYLIIAYNESTFWLYFTYPVWGVVGVNFVHIYKTLSLFIKWVRKSASD